MSDIYREQILDHFRNPRNWGKFENHDAKVREVNSSCGDVIEVYRKDSKYRFKGEGCAVSIASTSLLIERIKNKELRIKNVEDMAKRDMEKILGGKVGAARMKCVTLGLVALKKISKI